MESFPKLPKKGTKDGQRAMMKLVATKYESDHRRLCEQILLNAFGGFPGALPPFIADQNYRNTLSLFLPKDSQSIFASRPFVKGRFGCQLQKPGHDDKNGIVQPGLWMSVSIDPLNPVRLYFATRSTRWSIKVTVDRFAWFGGHVGHKAETESGMVIPSASKRLHHTCYTKPQHEWISTVLCLPENRHWLKVFEKDGSVSIKRENATNNGSVTNQFHQMEEKNYLDSDHSDTPDNFASTFSSMVQGNCVKRKRIKLVGGVPKQKGMLDIFLIVLYCFIMQCLIYSIFALGFGFSIRPQSKNIDTQYVPKQNVARSNILKRRKKRSSFGKLVERSLYVSIKTPLLSEHYGSAEDNKKDNKKK